MKGHLTHMCMQTPDMKLSSVQRSLHCASSTFVSIVFYLSTLPLHSIVCNLAVIASDFCTPTAFPMFIFSSWAYCIFYVWCRWAKNQHLSGLRGERVRAVSYTTLPHTKDQSNK